MLNETPFSADRGGYRDRSGAEVWMGVLRASFEVREGGVCKRAADQTRPLRAATWLGEPAQSSLLDDADLLPRAGTDVLIRGHACAPGGRAVRTLDVGWRLGNQSKVVRVHGERRWERGRAEGGVERIVPGLAASFERVPLVYERAFGGFDPKAPAGEAAASATNPVGSGFAYQPEDCLGLPAPQLEPPNAELVAGPHHTPPAGFGPIAPHWQPRAGLAGTYDDAWRADRAPLVPHDYQEAFVRSAPHDQQLAGFLRGGEIIELEHMTPDGLWRVQLPEISVRMSVVFSDGSEQSEARLQIVRLLPDARRVELSWLATLAVQGREHKLLRAGMLCKGERACL